MTTENKIAPRSEFQKKYLQSDAQIMLVGGAAGSSKSYVGLMRHLRFAEDPNYRGYCIRKNSTAIMKSGGLFWEAVALYRQYDPKLKVKMKDQKVIFSSGAEVSFSHYENTNAGQMYQGIQISNVFYDEVSHSEEEHIWWLWSRLRSTATNVHSLWLSCNPDVDSWLLKYARWYLYPEGHELAGRPDPEKNGTIRYLLRINGDLVWGDTAEELVEKYGKPELPFDHEEQIKPISFQGLFGTIDDNPSLKKSNPLYKSNLEALPFIEKERLLFGNWFARPLNSSYWERSYCEEILTPPMSEFDRVVRAYDFAGEIPNSSNGGRCDYFASVKMGRKKSSGEYVILDVVRTHLRFGEWENFIVEQAIKDGGKVDIILPEDPNAASKGACRALVNKIIGHGFRAMPKKALNNKLDRFRLFAAASYNGYVSVVQGCATDLWDKVYGDNTFFYKELEAFDGGRKGHDDMADCCSDCFNYLSSRGRMPSSSFLHGVLAAASESPNPLLQIK